MSEIRSSQRRRAALQRDSSVTQVRIEIAPGIASTASGPDDQATVISQRAPGSEDSAPPPLLAPLEVGKLLEGEQLGQFELRQFVGGGGMGVVFRAWDTTLNREVAVKVLSRDQSSDDETVRRFRNEAQSAARLDHGNIARVFYVGEDRGVNYIVFEFIEGVNLRDLVDRHGPLPIDEAIDYTLQVAEALDHASQRDVIHRDIKPSNVLVTAEGTAKLVDMGLARLHQVEHTNDDLTASGVTLGTFDYISPEQARDPRSADVRSDLYSLGCSLYFMLVGQPPFPHGTVLQKLLQHQGEEPPNPRSLRPNLPTELVRIVRKLLAKSPGQRYQRPIDLITDLQKLRDGLQDGVVATPQTSWTSRSGISFRRLRKHLPWAVPLVALVVISLGLDVYWSQADRAAALGLPTAGSDSSKPDNAPATQRLVHESPLQPSEDTTAQSNVLIQDGDASGGPASKPRSIAPAATNNSQKSSATTSSPAPANGRKSPRLPSAGRKATEGLLVVGASNVNGQFASLQAACAAAKNGDVVELRFNGRRNETPFQISDTKITIRAGDDFSPIVRFAPRENPTGAATPAMLTVAGGSVSLMNVAIEFDVPKNTTSDGWSLFEVRRPELVRLDRTSLTIRNAADGGGAFQPKVSFFAVTTDDRAEKESDLTPRSAASRAPVAIELQDCVARGEATFVRLAGGESARVFWENGLLMTPERMLVANNSADAPFRSRVEFDARHLTAIVSGGLAWLDFRTHGTGGLLADLRLAGCIVQIGDPAPMIDQLDPTASVDSEGTLSWSGDRNYYEGIDVFWKRALSVEPDSGQRLTFEGWQSFWGQSRETLPKLNSVVWQKTPSRKVPYCQRTAADYSLSTTTANNPARDSASDGLDAGCLPNQLPPLPSQ